MPPRRRKPPRAGALTDLPPLKIIRSILLLQLSYYVTATILILFTTIVLGQRFSIALILDWKSVRGDNTLGWTIGVVWLLVGFISVIPILILISRSKLVPDFALTILFVHLVVTILYTRSIPTNLLWWALQFTSAALMVFLGIWACRYRELQPISFGTLTGTKKSTTTTNNQNAMANGGIELDENIRGMPGKGGRGGPSYDMVPTKDGDDNV